MASILPFLRVGSDFVFDDEATHITGLAYESACGELHESNLTQFVRETIADRIIEAAKRGERDPTRLCSFAVAAIKGDRKTG